MAKQDPLKGGTQKPIAQSDRRATTPRGMSQNMGQARSGRPQGPSRNLGVVKRGK